LEEEEALECKQEEKERQQKAVNNKQAKFIANTAQREIAQLNTP